MDAAFKEYGTSIVLSVVGTIVCTVLAVVWRRGILKAWKAVVFYWQYLSSIRKSGIAEVISERNDYDRMRYGRISASIGRAKRDLLISSVSLITGIQHEGILPTLKGLVGKSVKVIVLLLNPKYEAGIEVIAASFGNSKSKIKEDIFNSLIVLRNFREGLAPEERASLSVRVYSAVPFASAVLIDAMEVASVGVIRIETKPYKAPMGQSWGVEIRDATSPLYRNFRASWLKLLDDSVEFDPAVHLGTVRRDSPEQHRPHPVA